MTLRLLYPAVALFACGVAAAPAFAAAADDRSPTVAQAMREPATQDAMAGAIRDISEALLDLRIAPFLKAIEAAEGGSPGEVDPDLSLRDYAGPEAERVPRELSHRLPGVMDAMGEMTSALEAALPAVAAAAQGVRERFDDELGR